MDQVPLRMRLWVAISLGRSHLGELLLVPLGQAVFGIINNIWVHSGIEQTGVGSLLDRQTWSGSSLYRLEKGRFFFLDCTT